MSEIEERGEFFIPYLGMLLRDLNFYEEKYKYILENGCINIEKIEIINGLIDRYLKIKKDEKENSRKDKDMTREFKFLENLTCLSEEDLEKISKNTEKDCKCQKFGRRMTVVDNSYFNNI